MTITSAEISGWVGSYLWPFFRIGALVGVAPIFGAHTVPVRARIGLALALTLLVVPLLPPAPAIDALIGLGALVAFHQVAIGAAMGFALLLVFGAFVLGGEIFAMQMGLGFASLLDPQRGVPVPVVSQFYVLLATLVFLALDGHLVLLEVLVDSFRTIPVGPRGLSPAGMHTLVNWAGHMFSGAVLIALPAITTLLVVNIAFGVMTRAAPQLNIFAVGFPVIMTAGFIAMWLTLPSVVAQLQSLAAAMFELLRGLLAGGG